MEPEVRVKAAAVVEAVMYVDEATPSQEDVALAAEYMQNIGAVDEAAFHSIILALTAGEAPVAREICPARSVEPVVRVAVPAEAPAPVDVETVGVPNP